MSAASTIKHFLGVVWSGVIKTDAAIEKDGPAIEAVAEDAADVTSFVDPAAGVAAHAIVAGGITALGALTEALQASAKTAADLEASGHTFTTVTISTQAVVEAATLFETYKAEFEKIKALFEKQSVSPAVAAGAQTQHST